jgi:hypothetical protein
MFTNGCVPYISLKFSSGTLYTNCSDYSLQERIPHSIRT